MSFFRMKLAVSALQALLLFPCGALAVAPSNQLSPGSGAPRGAEPIYKDKVASLSRTYARGKRPVLSHAAFERLDWVERTALLNVVCAHESKARCDMALDLGLGDNALVVRDHALRLLLAAADADPKRQREAARRIVEDDRNYRRGQGLWIVDRARSALGGRAPSN